MNDRISVPVTESRLPVGSSAKMIWDVTPSARATATRCCWPPESSLGRCCRRSWRPTVVTTWSIHSRSPVSPTEHHRQPDVLVGGQGGDQVEGLEDEAHLGATELRERLVVEGREIRVADERRARRERVEPGEAVQQRRLARSRRTHDRGEPAHFERHGHPVEGIDLGRRCRRSSRRRSRRQRRKPVGAVPRCTRPSSSCEPPRSVVRRILVPGCLLGRASVQGLTSRDRIPTGRDRDTGPRLPQLRTTHAVTPRAHQVLSTCGVTPFLADT